MKDMNDVSYNKWDTVNIYVNTRRKPCCFELLLLAPFCNLPDALAAAVT
jgi:hypothetical protein